MKLPKNLSGRKVVDALVRELEADRERPKDRSEAEPAAARPARGLSRAALAGTQPACPRAGHAQRLTLRRSPARTILPAEG